MAESIVYFINDKILWNTAFIVLALFSGFYFSCRTRFIQFRGVPQMLRLLGQRQTCGKGVSSFQALALALAGRVGTGNIAGTATAIFYGGAGALFWMWVITLLGAASAYMESTLAQIWKEEIKGQYRGGPAYYIEKGLGCRGYAALFACLTILACGLLLPGVQANSIFHALNNAVTNKFSPVVVGGILTGFLAVIICGGIKSIAKVAEIIVPVMAVGYVVLALIIIVVHLPQLPEVFAAIFSGAFDGCSAGGGMMGAAIAWGVRRGIFSNEAGQGTAAHAAAAAAVQHPVEQGLVQAFSVYIDTLLVCSATGLMILMTDSYNVLAADGSSLLVNNLPGIEAGSAFTQAAVSSCFPAYGSLWVAIALVLFAFTTIISYYYQAETNLTYLLKNKKHHWAYLGVLRLAFLGCLFGSVFHSSGLAWFVGDIGAGLMAWSNFLALWLLQQAAVDSLRDYETQIRRGQFVSFRPEKLGIKNADFWQKQK